MTPADGLAGRPAGHLAQRPVEDGDAQVAVEDHHAVSTLIQNSVQSLLLLIHLLVEARVAHGDGCLFGETTQQVTRVLDEVVAARLEDVDEADDGIANAQRQADHLRQS